MDHRETEHEIAVNAPAGDVFKLIEEVRNWPGLFPPTINVDHVEQAADSELIRIWATANGEVKNWTSRRVVDPAKMRIDFRQERSQPPVASMGGAWIIEPVSATQSRVRLRHDFRAIDDDSERLDWIGRAVDTNSRAELAALKTNVERATGDLMFTFTDGVTINGAIEDVYEFINEADQWKERLPHVSRVVLTEDTPGVQTLEMDTRTPDGSVHTTKSVRVCFPYHRIVYKQITLPALMTSHTGRWVLAEDPADATVTAESEHTVTINEANITKILGADADVTRARDFVRHALGANSMATLRHAKGHAERWIRK